MPEIFGAVTGRGLPGIGYLSHSSSVRRRRSAGAAARALRASPRCIAMQPLIGILYALMLANLDRYLVFGLVLESSFGDLCWCYNDNKK